MITRKEVLRQLGWFQRWLVQQSRVVQGLVFTITVTLAAVSWFVPPLIDPIPIIDEIILSWFTLASFNVLLNEGPRYRRVSEHELLLEPKQS